MRLTHSVEARQQLTQRIDPRQILASEILTWTTSELEAAVDRELAENPAMESREERYYGAEAGGMAGSTGADRQPGATSVTSLLNGSSTRENTTSNLASSLAGGDWDEDDPLERLASRATLKDHLREQVGQVARNGVRADIVRHLIECIDERGYLNVEADEVADQFRVLIVNVEEAISALQTMDPPGVGARELKECLRLQAEYLEQAGEGHPLARRILASCWDDLIARREERISTRLRVPVNDVRSALRFIRDGLTPYPGSCFRPDTNGKPSGVSGAVRPDLVFFRTEAGFLVEITRDFEETLTVAPLWQKLIERGDKGADESVRRYVRDHVERAQAFLNGLARRGKTLRAIAQALVEHQQGFIETGNRAFLRPLTRQMLAEKLELDESVISRAVADKWVLLPNGEVVALDAFFGTAHAIREALVSLVAEEDPTNPYSDDEIADVLRAQGYELARRTVAKYRGLEKILPARLRKRTPKGVAA